MNRDEMILRELAKQYKEYAFSDRNLKKKEMHIALNDLRMQKPVLLIDELPWHELNHTGELTVQCTDPYLREVETYLRQMLYRQRHIPGDMVLPQELKVSKVIHSSGIGISVKEDIAVSDAANRIVSHRFIDQMKDESCMELLHNEEITLDEKESLRRYELVANMVGDILPVRLVGSPWCFDTLWDDVATLHGVGQILVDLLERPEYMHALAQKLTDIFLDKVRQYEELNLERLRCSYPFHRLCGKSSISRICPGRWSLSDWSITGAANRCIIRSILSARFPICERSLLRRGQTMNWQRSRSGKTMYIPRRVLRLQ